MNRRFWLRLGIFVGSFLLVELFFRLIGFGTRPLYQESLDYEYALISNQKVKRLNVEFTTNSLGMRSRELDSKSKLILGFGDSVINGGMAISQEELASSIIDSALTASGSEYQFANVSAGSWGVSNAFAWLMSKELNDPEIIVLLFSAATIGMIIWILKKWLEMYHFIQIPILF